jgi:hypothetical protein
MGQFQIMGKVTAHFSVIVDAKNRLQAQEKLDAMSVQEFLPKFGEVYFELRDTQILEIAHERI